MAGSVNATPGFNLQPSAERVPVASNYITDFDFLNQYLPDTYEKEFERYGNRTISGFLRMVGAEMPTNSDLIKWAEQGRLHTKYTNVTTTQAPGAISTAVEWTVNDALVPAGTVTTGGDGGIAIRIGQTVFITATNAGTGVSNKGVVTAVDYAAGTFEVRYYEANQNVPNTVACSRR